PEPTDLLVVDDDLEVMSRGKHLFIDDDQVSSTDDRPGIKRHYAGWPIILALRPGAKLRIRAIDCCQTEAILGDLYLHRSDGTRQRLWQARKDRSTPRLPHVFFDEEFDLATVFPTPLPARPTTKATPKTLDALWTDLASEDAAKGYLASWALAALPSE